VDALVHIDGVLTGHNVLGAGTGSHNSVEGRTRAQSNKTSQIHTDST
jgi:hypothetical protein